MARAQGARAQMALAFETTYGTPPVSGFTKMPFASTTLGAEQPLQTSELLGYGRDRRSGTSGLASAELAARQDVVASDPGKPAVECRIRETAFGWSRKQAWCLDLSRLGLR